MNVSERAALYSMCSGVCVRSRVPSMSQKMTVVGLAGFTGWFIRWSFFAFLGGFWGIGLVDARIGRYVELRLVCGSSAWKRVCLRGRGE